MEGTDLDSGENFEEIDAAVCPLCGGQAEWSFMDDEMTRMEVLCRDCGRFEVPKADFDDAQVQPLTERGSV